MGLLRFDKIEYKLYKNARCFQFEKETPRVLLDFAALSALTGKGAGLPGLGLALQQGMAEDEKLLLAGAVLLRQGRPASAPGASSFTSSEAGYSPPSRQTRWCRQLTKPLVT